MPLFTVKRNVSTSGIIRVSQETALLFLHNMGGMITLNPLVQSYETLPDDPSTFVITDRLKVLFWTTTTKYTARGTTTDDGIIFVVKAGGGMTSTNRWKCSKRDTEDGSESVEVIEDAIIEVYISHCSGGIRS